MIFFIKFLILYISKLVSSDGNFKFEGSEYYMDSLPDPVKKLVAGINSTDLQIKIYQDTLKLISVGKSKLVEELKKGLEDIDPIDAN